jgi:hypothetical protein
MAGPDAREALLSDLQRERDAFFATLAAVERGSMTTPGLIGEWSARELIAHLGYWVGHAAESIHAVETGRAEEFGQNRPAVDDVNATVARVATATSFATVRKREAASVEALIDSVRAMDPSLLPTSLPHHGLTLEEGLREDGPDHYREHTEQLRQVLEEPARG